MREMTSLERVRTVLAGGIPDRLPVIPQGFMFSAAAAGYRIGQINRDPAKMARCHVACQEKYGFDGCVIDVDDASLAEACGAKVIFRDNDVASVDGSHPLLDDLRDIDGLRMPDPYKDGRLGQWLETTSRVVEAIGDHVFVMGRADQGPFSLLCLLRGTENFMCDLLTEDEEVIFHALEWTTEVHARFAKAQFDIGAHASSMGDALAGPNLISPAMYRKFGYPYEKKVVERLKAAGKPYSVHICGDTNTIVKDMGSLGCEILEVDWKVDLGAARKAIDPGVTLMGNVDPSGMLVLGSPEEVEGVVKRSIEATKGFRYIVSSGCAMGANTRPENVAAMVEAAKKYGSRDRILELRSR